MKRSVFITTSFLLKLTDHFSLRCSLTFFLLPHTLSPVQAPSHPLFWSSLLIDISFKCPHHHSFLRFPLSLCHSNFFLQHLLFSLFFALWIIRREDPLSIYITSLPSDYILFPITLLLPFTLINHISHPITLYTPYHTSSHHITSRYTLFLSVLGSIWTQTVSRKIHLPVPVFPVYPPHCYQQQNSFYCCDWSECQGDDWY